MEVPKYITALTRKDFEEIAAAANPMAGIGIEINKSADSVEIGINESQFKRMLWSFYNNGGFQAQLSELDNIPLG